MSGKLDWKTLSQKLLGLFQKYKFVLLVILAGIILLLLPRSGGEKEKAASGTDANAFAAQEFDLEGMEHKLEDVLSDVAGAGKVRVVLTVKGGTRQVVAQDGKTSDREDSTSTVVVSKGSGVEETVLLQQIYPQYQGALVVCAGGDDPAVRLKIVEAVSALTGLGSDKISICKSK